MSGPPPQVGAALSFFWGGGAALRPPLPPPPSSHHAQSPPYKRYRAPIEVLIIYLFIHLFIHGGVKRGTPLHPHTILGEGGVLCAPPLPIRSRQNASGGFLLRDVRTAPAAGMVGAGKGRGAEIRIPPAKKYQPVCIRIPPPPPPLSGLGSWCCEIVWGGRGGGGYGGVSWGEGLGEPFRGGTTNIAP